MSLGQNIKSIRESRGLTIEQVVIKLGIFKSIYLDIESGAIKPRPELLRKIATAFSLNENDIIDYRIDVNNRIARGLNAKNLKDVEIAGVVDEPLVSTVQGIINKIPVKVIFEDVTAADLISKRPQLLTLSEIIQIGDRIKTVGLENFLSSDVVIDSNLSQIQPPSKNTGSLSSFILNTTRPFKIAGVEKTLFYTEISTDFKKGDFVFISGGNFDSKEYIKKRAFKSGIDGYRVLFVDNCRLVLDIDFNNTKPYNNLEIDKFVNLHYIKNRDELLQATRQFTTIGGNLSKKFSAGKNNFIYVDSRYIREAGWGEHSGIDEAGFYIFGTQSWIQITNEFINGDLSIVGSGPIHIIGGSFEYTIDNGHKIYFTEDFAYEWKWIEEDDGLVNYYTWAASVEYNRPIVTKSNFVHGKFLGEFNSGLFGSYERRANWKDATWNGGFLLNTSWESGKMGSKLIKDRFFVSDIDQDNNPYERIGIENNSGFGYNFIYKSELKNSNIENGNFYYSSIGDVLNSNPVFSEITDSEFLSDSTVLSGKFKNSIIKSSNVKNSEINNTEVLKSRVELSKSINSQFISSMLIDSVYLGNEDIKIINYDEWAIKEIPGGNLPSHKIYKFYISYSDFKKLRVGQTIYLKNIIIKDSSKHPIRFFDRKYKISTRYEFFDRFSGNDFIKAGHEVGVFLSTPRDNDWKLNYIQSETVITEENQNKGYSVDIALSILGNNGIINYDPVTKEIPINGTDINKNSEISISGKQDLGFDPGLGFRGFANVIKIDKNGKILVGGSFTSYNGQTANRIIRLNSDGSIDDTFNTGSGALSGFDGEVYTIEIDNNDKILVGGLFRGFNGTPSSGMIRLNADGSVDKPFDFRIYRVSGSPLPKIRAIAIGEDDSIIAVGWFNRYNIGNESYYWDRGSGNIIKLNSDGSVDENFIETSKNPFASNSNGIRSGFSGFGEENVYDIKIDNGNIFVSGSFIEYDKINSGNPTPLNGIAKLDFNGNLSTTFSAPSLTPQGIKHIKTIEFVNDNLLIGGFNSQSGQTSAVIYSLDKSTGLINSTLPTISNINSTFSEINKIKYSSAQNRVYIAGSFNSPSMEMVVLKGDLSIDETFTISNRFDSTTRGIDEDEFGRIYVVGAFTTYNSAPYRGIVRINTLYSEPEYLGDNIDISKAYINTSDFQSGILENSIWISGDHINYSNDTNFVDNSVKDGTYSILAITQSSQLLVSTNHISSTRETAEDYFSPGDVVFLNGIDWTLDDGSSIRLPDSYVIESVEFGKEIRMREIGTQILTSITQSGSTFSTIGAQNRYNYIHSAKINNSKIYSGFFRRPYIKNTLIDNENLDVSDKNFSKIEQLRHLIISDSIFTDGGNSLNRALYMNSHFLGGSDYFEGGIVWNSVWNGQIFNDGLFRNSRWVDGIFENGLFYDNDTFKRIVSNILPFYYNERQLSYYKDGLTTATQSNDRYSWISGTFSGGDFFKSVWESGYLTGGRFFYSQFYSGTMSGGFIGDLSVKLDDTKVYNAVIEFTTVINALLTSTENYSGNQSHIEWIDGIFQGGIFETSGDNTAVWKNGLFNNGTFDSMVIWENGQFNGGKFISTFGWTMSGSAIQTDYTWHNGLFNGGEFGNSELSANSTWFTGQFNGGKFMGRVWNRGSFVNGEFIGSSNIPANGKVTPINSNASRIVDTYGPEIFIPTYTEGIVEDIGSYYGLWRDGFFTNNLDLLVDKNIGLDVNAVFRDALWMSGTFSHSSGQFRNSVWLTGCFDGGEFVNSSFNPYVERSEYVLDDGIWTREVNNDGSWTYSFDLTDNTIWKKGTLKNSDFFISKWMDGLFDFGDAWGMIWENGVSNYMNAFNIHWKSGLWKNGNWNGSYMEWAGLSMSDIESDFNKTILNRIADSTLTQSLHVWNLFDKVGQEYVYSDLNNTKIVFNSDIETEDPLPSSTTYSALVDGFIVKTNIGNGRFDLGVWENGVWNSGLRIDENVFEFDDVVFSPTILPPIEIESDRVWLFSIIGPKYGVEFYNIGDDVSISNVVAIDINENRKLLKDTYRIISKDVEAEILTLQLITSFPIRRIERDSLNHKIKITKNSWLSGVFLNGVFEGVWNFGLFRGYPKITKMTNTHWIDGFFQGGHFQSETEIIDYTGTFSGITFSGFNSSIGLTQSTYVYTKGLDGSINPWVGPVLPLAPLYHQFLSNVDYKKGSIIEIMQILGGSATVSSTSYVENVSYINDKIDPNNEDLGIWIESRIIEFSPDGPLGEGRLRGGEFLSVTPLDESSVLNIFRGGNRIPLSDYNTSLMQNVVLDTLNTSTIITDGSYLTPSDIFNYNSWIDVNYYTYSATNIGRKKKKINPISNKYTSDNNLYGYITNDVLSSVSTFRNSFSLENNKYMLGTKYKKYKDLVGDSSNFSNNFPTSVPSFFIAQGWTFSGGITFSINQDNDGQLNVDVDNLGILNVSNAFQFGDFNGVVRNKFLSTTTPRERVLSSGAITLESRESVKIEDGRYTMVEFDLIEAEGAETNISFDNYTGTHSPIRTPIDHINTPEIRLRVPDSNGYDEENNGFIFLPRKREYFYNKQNLSMHFTEGEYTIDNLKFYEVDMIPFFQYFTESSINMDLQVPNRGSSPYLPYNEYSKIDYIFIDNDVIGIDSKIFNID
jgi:transcriptional regulator with XRE-family HTH domain